MGIFKICVWALFMAWCLRWKIQSSSSKCMHWMAPPRVYYVCCWDSFSALRIKHSEHVASTKHMYICCVHTCVCILVNYNTHAASSAAHMTPYGIVKCVYLACRKNSDKRVNARSISPDNVPSRYIFIWWARVGQWQKKFSKLEQHCWVPRTLSRLCVCARSFAENAVLRINLLSRDWF